MTTKDRPWGALAFLSALTILSLLFVGSVFIALPKTVVTTHVDVRDKALMGQAVPQGWSFFTRDPQSTAVVLLDQSRKHLRVDSLPQTLPENAFGLTRNQRSQDTEKAAYSNEVLNWFECDGMMSQTCFDLASDEEAEEIKAVRGSANFCGAYLLVAQKPVPFLFRHSTSESTLVERVARVNIQCQGDAS